MLTLENVRKMGNNTSEITTLTLNIYKEIANKLDVNVILFNFYLFLFLSFFSYFNFFFFSFQNFHLFLGYCIKIATYINSIFS